MLSGYLLSYKQNTKYKTYKTVKTKNMSNGEKLSNAENLFHLFQRRIQDPTKIYDDGFCEKS